MLCMVERWTKERRLEHTRNLLIDAAEDVFARKGFAAATLEDIASTAGYTRGAFYVHFASKEDLFLALTDRYYRRILDSFAEVLASIGQVGDTELDRLADRWRQACRNGGAQHAALGYEFSLYLMRNPEARSRVAEMRRLLVESLADFVTSVIAGLDATLTMPASTFAQVLITTSDAIMVADEVEDVDLFRPMVDLYASAVILPS